MKKIFVLLFLIGSVAFGQTPLTTTRLTTDTVRMRKLTQLPTHPPTGFKMTDWINDLWLTDSVTHRKVLTDVITTAMKEPTGFLNNTTSHLSFTNHNRTLIITGSAYTTYYRGTPTVHSGDTIQIANTTGLHYIYYNSAGTLVETTVFPGFDQVLVAHVYWNASTGKGLLNWERHGIAMDWATHMYLHHTVGSRYESGFGATFGNTTFSIDGGDWHDEDIEHLVAAGTTATILYKNGAASYQWDTLQTNYMKMNGANIRYNNGTALADVGANAYVAYWIFVTSDSTMPYVSLMGQRTDVTIADARLNNTYESLSLGTLPYVEMKLLYRILLRNDATPYEEVKDYRATGAVGSSTYIATLHSGLSGLTADDHPNYAYLPGRATNQTYNGTNVANGDLTVQGTADTTRATSYVNLQPYGGGVNIGTQTGVTGYTLNNAGFYNSATTVNQSTYPTINASQTAATLQDGSAYVGTDLTMSTTYIAVKFTASGAHTMGDFTIRLKESANITNFTATLTGYIYSNNAGVPGTLLATGDGIRFGAITTSYQTLSVGTVYTMTAATDYWLVLKKSAATVGGDIILNSDVSADMGATSNDGTTWTKTTGRMRYAVRGLTGNGSVNFSTNNYASYNSSVTGIALYGLSTNNIAIQGASTHNTAGYFSSANGIGISSVSTNNTGGEFTSTTSTGGLFTSTSGISGRFDINPTSTNTTAEILRLRRLTSGTAADNIGGGMDWYIEDAAGTAELSARMATVLTTATNGAETSAMTWWTRTGGSAIAENMRLDGNGSLGLGVTPTATLHLKAGSATIAPIKLTTGTPLATTEAGAIEFDNSHLWFTVANGGARFQLDQQANGTTGYIPKFTGTNTIGNSIIKEVGAALTFDQGANRTLNVGQNTTAAGDGFGLTVKAGDANLTGAKGGDSKFTAGEGTVSPGHVFAFGGIAGATIGNVYLGHNGTAYVGKAYAVVPSDADSSNQLAPTAWVRKNFGDNRDFHLPTDSSIWFGANDRIYRAAGELNIHLNDGAGTDNLIFRNGLDVFGYFYHSTDDWTFMKNMYFTKNVYCSDSLTTSHFRLNNDGALGKVLTSDANGNGNWATPSIANLYLGASDTYAGVGAMTHKSGDNYSVAIGGNALHTNTTADFDVAIGYGALENSTQGGNTATGTSAGNGIGTGIENTFIGRGAGMTGTSQVDGVSGSTAIGSFSFTTKSNQISFGSTSIVENVLHGNMVHPIKPTGTITAGTGITVAMTSRVIEYSGASAIDITANPQIADGEDGQIVTIVGLSDTNTLKLDDGNGIKLKAGGSITLGAGMTVTVVYVLSLDIWTEI
jgi:hypothetical protein